MARSGRLLSGILDSDSASGEGRPLAVTATDTTPPELPISLDRSAASPLAVQLADALRAAAAGAAERTDQATV